MSVDYYMMEGDFETNSCLAPGFRFYPTEEELLTFYLLNKLQGTRQDLNLVMHRVVPVLDVYEYNPWELPQFSGDLCNGDAEQWFFFIPRQEREAQGGKPRRITTVGYWKGTGSPGYVYSSNNRIIGVKRSMVFYIGRAPNGQKTEWKMNSYKAIQWEISSSSAGACPKLRHEFSLCRLYKNSRCLRSFDRRPKGVDRIERARDLPVIDHGNDATTSIQDPSRVDPGRLLSPGVMLSSADNYQLGHSSQTSESSNTIIGGLADESLWDWEQLENWYNICGEDM